VNDKPTWFAPTDEPNSERWHGDLLALDPSVRSPGVSLFRHGCLFAVGRIRIDEEIHALPAAQRWLRVANEITAWWLEHRDGHDHLIRTLIYELPQIYSESEGKSKGNPNQLLGLVGTGQSLATLMTAYNIHRGARPPELLSPTPAEWTGQLPKTIKCAGKNVLPKDPRESPRGQRIWSRLEEVEREIVLASKALQHDAFDGMGLGLSALRRYDQRRVFPGAV
jgi:hypothetical protein